MMLELLSGYALSGSCMAYIALYSSGRDVALEIALGLFVVPLVGALGVILANVVFLRQRAMLIPKSLLACVFSIVWSGTAFFVLKFGLAALLVGWIGSVGVAYVVWHVANH
jgi:hypothetical protein